MNRFRKLGFINYDIGDNLRVHSSLLNVVLHDDETTHIPNGEKHIARAKRGLKPARREGHPTACELDARR